MKEAILEKSIELGDVEQYYNPPQSSVWKQIKEHKVFYFMLIPCIISFLIFSYVPMAGLSLAFREYGFNTGILGGEFVGLKYFENFFADSRSWLYIRNTIVISSIKLFLYLPFPIILALMFNEVKSTRLRSVMQSITYLPHFVSWVVVVGIIERLLAPDTGLINQLMATFGGDGSRFFMMEENYFLPILFSSYIWKSIGWDSIIYFAAIVAISPSLFEAASIDGANKFKQIIHITIPSIRPTIIILFILSLGSLMSAGFDQVYLLQNPANANLSQTIDTYIVSAGLQGGQFGYATAVGLMQGVIGLIATVIVNKIADKKYKSSLW